MKENLRTVLNNSNGTKKHKIQFVNKHYSNLSNSSDKLYTAR